MSVCGHVCIYTEEVRETTKNKRLEAMNWERVWEVYMHDGMISNGHKIKKLEK